MRFSTQKNKCDGNLFDLAERLSVLMEIAEISVFYSNQ